MYCIYVPITGIYAHDGGFIWIKSIDRSCGNRSRHSKFNRWLSHTLYLCVICNSNLRRKNICDPVTFFSLFLKLRLHLRTCRTMMLPWFIYKYYGVIRFVYWLLTCCVPVLSSLKSKYYFRSHKDKCSHGRGRQLWEENPCLCRPCVLNVKRMWP
jgi:hypothetical protein